MRIAIHVACKVEASLLSREEVARRVPVASQATPFTSFSWPSNVAMHSNSARELIPLVLANRQPRDFEVSTPLLILPDRGGGIERR